MPELYNILYVLFGAFTQACLSFFLDYTFKKGEIFQGYLPWLARKVLSKHEIRRINETEDVLTRRLQFIQAAEKETFFFKPLGACVVCSNIWQGMLSFWLVRWHFGLPIIYILPYLVISSFLVRRFYKV